MSTEVATEVVVDILILRHGLPLPRLGEKKVDALTASVIKRINKLLGAAGRKSANEIVFGEVDKVLSSKEGRTVEKETKRRVSFSGRGPNGWGSRSFTDVVYQPPYCVIQLAAQKGVLVHGE